MVNSVTTLAVLFAVENVTEVVELYATVKGRPRKTGDLTIKLDASVMTRSTSVNGLLIFCLVI